MNERVIQEVTIYPGPSHASPAAWLPLKRSFDRGTCWQGIELRIIATGVPTSFVMAEGNTGGCAIASTRRTPRSLRSQGMHGNSAREKPGDPIAGRSRRGGGPVGEGMSQESNMQRRRESDGCVLPSKCPTRVTACGGHEGEATGQGEH
jgi:hypothetical protein